MAVFMYTLANNKSKQESKLFLFFLFFLNFLCFVLIQNKNVYNEKDCNVFFIFGAHSFR